MNRKNVLNFMTEQIVTSGAHYGELNLFPTSQ